MAPAGAATVPPRQWASVSGAQHARVSGCTPLPKGAAFWTLVKGSRTEIRKVVWPTRQETVQTTMIVVAVVVVVALFLWALDSFLGWLVSMAIA